MIETFLQVVRMFIRINELSEFINKLSFHKTILKSGFFFAEEFIIRSEELYGLVYSNENHAVCS